MIASNTIHSNSANRGFSLVELMVAITISLFLSIGLVTVMANSTRTYNFQDDIARMTENGRFAMELMRRDIRMGGYYGCHDSINNVSNNLNSGTETLWGALTGIEGFEGGTGAWQPSGATYAEGTPPSGENSDAITLRFANPSTEIELNAPLAVGTDNIDIDGNGTVESSDGDVKPGEIWVITDCSNSDVFQVTNPTSGTSTSVQHGTGGSPGNATAQLNNAYGLSEFETDTPVLMQLRSVRYFVGPNSDGIPALQREEMDTNSGGVAITTTVDIIEGVDSLQFLYGEDDDGDGDVDAYREADDVTAWGQVRSVQVGLLLRSEEEYGESEEADTGTHEILGFTFDDPADLRVRRRIMTNTIAVRN